MPIMIELTTSEIATNAMRMYVSAFTISVTLDMSMPTMSVYWISVPSPDARICSL